MSNEENINIFHNDLENEFQIDDIFHNLQTKFNINPAIYVFEHKEIDKSFKDDVEHELEIIIRNKINKYNPERKKEIINKLNKVAVQTPIRNDTDDNFKYIVVSNYGLYKLIDSLGYVKYEILKGDILKGDITNLSELDIQLRQKVIDKENLKQEKLFKELGIKPSGFRDYERKHFESLNLNDAYLQMSQTRNYFTDLIFSLFLQYVRNEHVVNLEPSIYKNDLLEIFYHLLHELVLPDGLTKNQVNEHYLSIGKYLNINYSKKRDSYLNKLLTLLERYNLTLGNTYLSISNMFQIDNNLDERIANFKNAIRSLPNEEKLKIDMYIDNIINLPTEKQLIINKEENFNKLKTYNNQDLLEIFNTGIQNLLNNYKEKIALLNHNDEETEKFSFEVDKEKNIKQLMTLLQTQLQPTEVIGIKTQLEQLKTIQFESIKIDPLWIYYYVDSNLNGLYLHPNLNLFEYQDEIIRTIQMLNTENIEGKDSYAVFPNLTHNIFRKNIGITYVTKWIRKYSRDYSENYLYKKYIYEVNDDPQNKGIRIIHFNMENKINNII